MHALALFRRQIDEFMGHHPQSPLAEEQRAGFAGLDYFAANEALLLETAVDRFPAAEPVVEMQTSTGEVRPYRRWGRFNFTVDGQEASLTIYTDGQGLFLPFKDASNGAETYGAGRYLDDHRHGLEQLAGDKIRVDFNYCYNPYCAYSADYSCPLPPRENWLNVSIRAGEKDFRLPK